MTLLRVRTSPFIAHSFWIGRRNYSFTKNWTRTHRVPASNHTHFLLLRWQIFAVQLYFIQRILTQNRFTTKSCENCILGMKQRHTIGQGNPYVTTFTMCFYFPRITPIQRSENREVKVKVARLLCVWPEYLVIKAICNSLDKIKQDWNNLLSKQEKIHIVWCTSVRCRYPIGFCSVFVEGIISTANSKWVSDKRRCSYTRKVSCL